MSTSIELLLNNVVWQALTTEHISLAIASDRARRYPAEVVPFAALRELTPEALAELRELLLPGEELFLAWTKTADEKLPECRGIEMIRTINALRMFYPEGSVISAESAIEADPIETLTAENGPEMVVLTDVAFPGFFRSQTYRMGRYWGIRSGGKLIAMAGERLALPGWREVSAVCTHPGYTGRGYAARLVRYVLAVHAASGLRSFLHVTDSNSRAVSLYERLGFQHAGATQVTLIRRS